MPSTSNGAKVQGVNGAQAVTRVLAVLHLFRDQQRELGVVEVSKSLGLTISTTHRLIRALVAADYLAQNPRTEHYHLGRSAFLLGQAAQTNLGLDLVVPVLEQISNQTGESVNLGLLDGDRVVVVARVESRQPLRFSHPPGTRVRLYATSMGKAILAFNTELREYLDTLGDELEGLTPHTLQTKTELLRDLEEIKDRGWSIDNGESITGVRCVAAPIFDATGRAHAAVAVQAPEVRMPDDRLAAIGPLVIAAADEIGSVLHPGTAF
jgi:IclR family transcriptional regulator, acetate operon repressor